MLMTGASRVVQFLTNNARTLDADGPFWACIEIIFPLLGFATIFSRPYFRCLKPAPLNPARPALWLASRHHRTQAIKYVGRSGNGARPAHVAQSVIRDRPWSRRGGPMVAGQITACFHGVLFTRTALVPGEERTPIGIPAVCFDQQICRDEPPVIGVVQLVAEHGLNIRGITPRVMQRENA